MKLLTIIGGGNMGEAILAGLLRSGQWKPHQITVCDVRPEQRAFLKKRYRVGIASENSLAIRKASIILLAVKPQQMKALLQELKPFVTRKQLVLSIAAGISTQTIESLLIDGIPVVRIMPNTPALVSAGAAAISKGRVAKAIHERIALSIFSTIGIAVPVSENQMDAVTAISGSGPAYVFYLAEAMNQAALDLGLSPKIADVLVRQTIQGSGLLLLKSKESAIVLRQRVTSPGGTTEAAIRTLEETQVSRHFIQAIGRARERSKELSIMQ